MEISAYCSDLTSAGLCVTAAEISLTCGLAFYPESFSRLYKIGALGARFLTYSSSYTPCLSLSCGYLRTLYSGFEYYSEKYWQTRSEIHLIVSHVISEKLLHHRVIPNYGLEWNPDWYGIHFCN